MSAKNPAGAVPIANRLAALEAEAREIERLIAQEIDAAPSKPGPKKAAATERDEARPAWGLCADPEAMLAREAALLQALGPRTRGNVRWGSAALYAAVVQCFFELRARGVTLPRGKSLSVAALRAGLGEVLVQFGYLRDAELDALTERGTGEQRRKLADRLDHVFTRVADAVEGKHPREDQKISPDT